MVSFKRGSEYFLAAFLGELYKFMYKTQKEKHDRSSDDKRKCFHRRHICVTSSN